MRCVLLEFVYMQRLPLEIMGIRVLQSSTMPKFILPIKTESPRTRLNKIDPSSAHIKKGSLCRKSMLSSIKKALHVMCETRFPLKLFPLELSLDLVYVGRLPLELVYKRRHLLELVSFS